MRAVVGKAWRPDSGPGKGCTEEESSSALRRPLPQEKVHTVSGGMTGDAPFVVDDGGAVGI